MKGGAADRGEEIDERVDSCAECRFWVDAGRSSGPGGIGGDALGECRILPPGPQAGVREPPRAVWPLTTVKQWCAAGTPRD
jgi:hypothetical protein